MQRDLAHEPADEVTAAAGRLVSTLKRLRRARLARTRSDGTELRTRTVSAQDGTTLHVEVCGPGTKPLVMIHGLGYASWACGPIRTGLSRRRGFVSFDNRGTGRSGKPYGPYSVALMARDAATVLTEVTGPADVIAYSMGGYIALELALQRPELVRSLTLMATSAGGSHARPVPPDTRAAWLAAAHLSPEGSARATMPLSFASGWTDENPDRFEELLRARLRHPTPPHGWMAQFEAAAEHLRAGVDVERVNAPALVVHGTGDRVVPFENGEDLATRLPAARFLPIRGAGHNCWLEQPDVIQAAVGRFLARPGRR